MSGMQDLINKIAQPLNGYVENNKKLLKMSDSVSSNTNSASTNTVVKDTSASYASSIVTNSASSSNSAKAAGSATKASNNVKAVSVKASASSTTGSTKVQTITPSPKASASSTNLPKEEIVITSNQPLTTNCATVDSTQEKTNSDNGYFMFFSNAASSVVSTASNIFSGTTSLVSAAVSKASETTENLKNVAESTVYNIELKKVKVNAANDLLNTLNGFCNKVVVKQVDGKKFINQDSLLDALDDMVGYVKATINQVNLARQDHGRQPEGDCDQYLKDLEKTLAWFAELESQYKTKDNRHVALAIWLNYRLNDPRQQKAFSNCTNQQLVNIVTEKESSKSIDVLQEESSCDYVNAMFNLITDLVCDASKGGLEINTKHEKAVDDLLKKLSSDIILFNNDESCNLDTKDRAQRLKNLSAAFSVDVERFIKEVGNNAFCNNAITCLNDISNNVDSLNRQIALEETKSKQNQLRSKMA